MGCLECKKECALDPEKFPGDVHLADQGDHIQIVVKDL
jgi:hypothetical protein